MEPVQKGSGRLPLLFFQELLYAKKYGNVAHDPFDAVPSPLKSGLAVVASHGLNLEQHQCPLSAALQMQPRQRESSPGITLKLQIQTAVGCSNRKQLNCFRFPLAILSLHSSEGGMQ